MFLTLKFRNKMGYWINWEHPVTFSEKLQWLKLYNRNPEYSIMADKVMAKEWVAERIGSEYIIPTLGVWDNTSDIDFSKLPDKFVIKCNHNSGLGMYICRDKSKLNVREVRNALNKGLAENYFKHNGEWPYKDIPRKIIAEKYLENGLDTDLVDYKFFCFNGVPQFLKVDFNRFSDSGHRANYYDLNWNLLPFGEAIYPPDKSHIEYRPERLDKMIDLAKSLAKGTTFLRVDFYNICGHIYFGELTFFPASGLGEYTPKEYDKIIGQRLPPPTAYVVDAQHSRRHSPYFALKWILFKKPDYNCSDLRLYKRKEAA